MVDNLTGGSSHLTPKIISTFRSCLLRICISDSIVLRPSIYFINEQCNFEGPATFIPRDSVPQK